MKKITAIIKPHKLDEVKEALKGAGVTGLTVSDVKGFGRQGGHTEIYRGAEYVVDLVPKTKITMVVKTEDADRVCRALAAAAYTGKIGDGKIWISPIERVFRIRTGEIDDDAV